MLYTMDLSRRNEQWAFVRLIKYQVQRKHSMYQSFIGEIAGTTLIIFSKINKQLLIPTLINQMTPINVPKNNIESCRGKRIKMSWKSYLKETPLKQLFVWLQALSSLLSMGPKKTWAHFFPLRFSFFSHPVLSFSFFPSKLLPVPLFLPSSSKAPHSNHHTLFKDVPLSTTTMESWWSLPHILAACSWKSSPTPNEKCNSSWVANKLWKKKWSKEGFTNMALFDRVHECKEWITDTWEMNRMKWPVLKIEKIPNFGLNT